MSAYWLLRNLPAGTVNTVTWGLPQTWRNVDGLPSLSNGEKLDHGWEPLADATLSGPDAAIVEPLVRASVISRLTSYRYVLETGGITVSGIAISTDRESQGLIDSMQRLLSDEVIASVKFKSAAGIVIDCNLALASALRSAVGVFVQQCRNNEAEHAEAIGGLVTVDELIEYNFTTGWPSP